jgi:hypothetical protein
MALAHADDATADGDLDSEHLVVIRPDGVEEAVLRALSREALGVFLQSTLGALERPERAIACDLGGGEGSHEAAGGDVPQVEVDGADESLKGGREQGRPEPATALSLSFTQQKILAKTETAGQTGKAGGADDRGSPSGENSLVIVRTATVQDVRYGQAHYRVAKELKALVVAGGKVPMLVQIAAVNQRLLQQVEVTDREPQPLGKSGRGAHQSSG